MGKIVFSILIFTFIGGCVFVAKSPPPPPIHARPRIVLIPEVGIYYAPDLSFELYFHKGFWYYSYRGHWYYSEHYGGPWILISPKRLPKVFHHIPPRYRKHR